MISKNIISKKTINESQKSKILEEYKWFEKRIINRTKDMQKLSIKFYHQWKSLQTGESKAKFLGAYESWRTLWKLLEDQWGPKYALKITPKPNKDSILI